MAAVLPAAPRARTASPKDVAGVPLRLVAQSLFAADAVPVELQCVRSDGAIISLVGLPAVPSDVAVLVVADVTERERRRRAEQEFVADASHELRTPVTAITSAVDALRNGALEDPEARDRFVDVIERQSLRLSRLTRSLLTLARAQTRQEELQLEPVELQALLDQVVAAAGSVADGRIRIERGDPITAIAQRAVLEQVVENLLGNALKHGDGRPSCSGHGVRMAWLTIEIADSGPGIPAEEQARVSRPLLCRGR